MLPLARNLVEHCVRQKAKAFTGFTPEAEAALQAHPWPGNVRERRNAIERGAILSPGPLVGLSQLPGHLKVPSHRRVEVGGPVTIEELEAEHIRRVVATAPSLDDAARILGIDPSTLYRKRKKLEG